MYEIPTFRERFLRTLTSPETQARAEGDSKWGKVCYSFIGSRVLNSGGLQFREAFSWGLDLRD